MADTIAAISTPVGEGGIGIVRLSGSKALSIMKEVFTPLPEEVEPRHAYFGKVINVKDNSIIDEAICIYMNAPHSYTCEDVVEIQAHGGTVSLRMILRNVINAGARIAEPGEFTKLAFLNGRIDLIQAEAVIDVIKAKSEVPLSIAERQLQGKLGVEITQIRSKMLNILAQMAVNIDFPDEDIEQVAYDDFSFSLLECKNRIKKLLDTADSGRIAREGIKVAIIGRPNVGKSSLMNSILGENRAIVTDIPGTTRDTIEEVASISGIPIVITDTAGIRETDDVIEKMGIERSFEKAEDSDLVVLVIDGSVPLEKEDIEIIKGIRQKNILIVINKRDLGKAVSIEEIKRFLPEADFVSTALIKPDGADIVMNKIRDMFMTGLDISGERNIVTNERHHAALQRAYDHVNSAIDLLERLQPLEISEIDVHSSYDALGEIIGETAGEEIIDTVFAKFCLGK